jgi:hypothetical protein
MYMFCYIFIREGCSDLVIHVYIAWFSGFINLYHLVDNGLRIIDQVPSCKSIWV